MKRSGSANTALTRRSMCKGMLGAAGAALWTPLSGCGNRALASTVAETTAGKLRGVSEGPIKVFRGIPYGANTAMTRFQRCVAPRAWSGERDATAYGAMAPQRSRPYEGGRSLLKSWHIQQDMSEECLYLNVWTPGLRSDAKRPVMVWLHGGGFFAGTGATHAYDGARLAQRGDVVVVTVNHRLNIFGYLYLAEYGEQYADSGNVGQHDLIAALKWIRDNISEFGGDPGNVMIFGESGGAGKVCALLGMPEAEGLFHRAAAQSGHLIWGGEPAEAAEVTREALALLGVDATERSGLTDALSRLSMEQILEASMKIAPAKFSRLAPVVDGRGLPRHPFAPDAPTVSSKVPLLIGINRTETTYLFDDPKNFALSWEALPAALSRFLQNADVAKVIADYRALMPAMDASNVFFDITTQIAMGRNAYTIAQRKDAQNAAPVYFYELNWDTPADGGKWQCPHTLEIPLVFDNVAKVPSMFGGSVPAEAQQLANQMSDAWIAFAHSGNPNNKTIPEWPAFDAQRRQVMRFDVTSSVVNDPLGPKIEILKDAADWNIVRTSL